MRRAINGALLALGTAIWDELVKMWDANVRAIEGALRLSAALIPGALIAAGVFALTNWRIGLAVFMFAAALRIVNQ